jgi:hypothetical protein
MGVDLKLDYVPNWVWVVAAVLAVISGPFLIFPEAREVAGAWIKTIAPMPATTPTATPNTAPVSASVAKGNVGKDDYYGGGYKFYPDKKIEYSPDSYDTYDTSFPVKPRKSRAKAPSSVTKGDWSSSGFGDSYSYDYSVPDRPKNTK